MRIHSHPLDRLDRPAGLFLFWLFFLLCKGGRFLGFDLRKILSDDVPDNQITDPETAATNRFPE